MPILARFLQVPRLSSAANNNPPLRRGESGKGVLVVQQALLDTGTMASALGAVDGAFGAKTEACVKAFQTKNRLVTDGLVGKQVLSKLSDLLGTVVTRSWTCGTPFVKAPVCTQECPALSTLLATPMTSLAGRTLRSVVPGGAGSGSGGMAIPTSLRFLTASEQAMATGVFGSSLFYWKILISNGLGLEGRPLTTIGPFPGFVTLNLGPATISTSLLIHELTHAWQSQHHPIAIQFMVNSAQSQAAAMIAGGDAYKYTPGKSFGMYAAEQIAQQVEDGQSPIVSHVKGASSWLPDGANILSLSVPRWE